MFKRFWDWLTSEVRTRALAEGIKIGRRDAYRDLRGDAYWFTEDLITRRLLNALADQGLDHWGGRPSRTLEDIRKEWRTARNHFLQEKGLGNGS